MEHFLHTERRWWPGATVPGPKVVCAHNCQVCNVGAHGPVKSTAIKLNRSVRRSWEIRPGLVWQCKKKVLATKQPDMETQQIHVQMPDCASGTQSLIHHHHQQSLVELTMLIKCCQPIQTIWSAPHLHTKQSCSPAIKTKQNTLTTDL